MEAISRFFSELWMLFREMYGLEIVVGIVFFLLGLWLVWIVASERRDRIKLGLEKQERLKEAVEALRGGMAMPVAHAAGVSASGSGRGSSGESGKLFRKTEATAEKWLGASDGLAGADDKGIDEEKEKAAPLESKETGTGDTLSALEKETASAASDFTEVVKTAKDGQPHLSGKDLAEKITGRGGGEEKRESGGDEVSKSSDEIKKPEPPALTAYETAADAFLGEDGIEVNRELGIVFESRPDAIDDLKQIKGIGAKIEGQLNEFGVYRIAQIAHWNAYNAEEFGNQLRFKGRVEREKWIPQAKRLCETAPSADPKEGASGKPELKGTRPEAEVTAAKEADGEPSTATSSGEVRKLDTAPLEIPLPEISDYAKAKAAFGTEPVEVDREMGILFPHRPGIEDDLTEIDGIDPDLRRKLNDEGIYRFQQIARWNDYNVAKIDRELSLRVGKGSESWIPEAKKLASRASRNQEKVKKVKKEFAGESVSVKPGIGIVYLDPPKRSDDLADVEGIESGHAKKLQELGIQRYKQIALWSDANAKAVDKELGLKAGSAGAWRDEARTLAKRADAEGEKEAAEFYRSVAAEAFGDEEVTVDEKLGILFKHRPKKVDDLTRIKGIAKVLSGRLNESGVYRFQQIALWNEYTVKAFAKRLKSFQDRMYRDRWIEQATEFAKEEDEG